MFGLVTLVVLMVATLALPAKPAEATTIVRIRSFAYGTCLTGDTITTVKLETCLGNSNFEPWYITPVAGAYTIQSVAWLRCLWVPSGFAGTGAQLNLCGAAPADQWFIAYLGGGVVMIHSALAPNHCLTAKTPSGTDLVLDICTGAPEQLFIFL